MRTNKFVGVLLFSIIFTSCISIKVGSTNFLNDGLYAVTITSDGSTSDEELARIAASSISVNIPFAYGITSRSSQSDLAQSIFWGVP